MIFKLNLYEKSLMSSFSKSFLSTTDVRIISDKMIASNLTILGYMIGSTDAQCCMAIGKMQGGQIFRKIIENPQRLERRNQRNR